MTSPAHALGLAAEELVATWLQRQGWQVLARRHRSLGGGELDIVAIDPGGALVGVEVRARRSSRTGEPEATIDRRKATRLGRSLVAFAAEQRLRHSSLRIDLVSVLPEHGSSVATGRWRVRRTPNIGA